LGRPLGGESMNAYTVYFPAVGHEYRDLWDDLYGDYSDPS